MKAIIIEDELNSRELLSTLAQKYTPQIDIVAQYENAADALDEIHLHKPDILFLDIEMPNMNGFDFLEKCTYNDFYLVFTTAYNEYAIQAIKSHAFDYLLKPLQRKEFIETICRIEKEKLKNDKSQIDKLLNHLKKEDNAKKIILTTSDGLHFVNTDEIMYVKGEGSYSKYYCLD
ncbi:MAG: response regulator, partial [Bacteroidota bacterium]